MDFGARKGAFYHPARVEGRNDEFRSLDNKTLLLSTKAPRGEESSKSLDLTVARAHRLAQEARAPCATLTKAPKAAGSFTARSAN